MIKKIALSNIVVLLLFLIPFGNKASSQETNGSLPSIEAIRNYRVNVNVKPEGKVHVREIIKYDFGFWQKHGIIRQIPYIKTNKEGKKFKLDIDIFTVKNELCDNYQFQKSVENDVISVKIGDPDKTVTGINTYILSYEVSGAITYFSDHDELWWNAVGDEWSVPISSASILISTPSGGKPESYRWRCYSGSVGSEGDDCVITSKINSAEIQLARPLNSGEGLGFIVSFEPGLMARLEPIPLVSFWETIL